MEAPLFAHPASRLALEVFRCNGALIGAGDAMLAPLGLTSARWQVMGAVAEAGGALPVAGLARNMGLVRQSVQRIVNELVAAGVLRLLANPHHRRARLVAFTDEGAALFEAAGRRWLPFADRLVALSGGAAVARAEVLLRGFRDAIHRAEGERPG